MSAQLKKVVDRFYAVEDLLQMRRKKAVLLATCADVCVEAMDALVAHFKSICHYLRWDIAGQVLAFGVSERKDIEASEYGKLAWNLAVSL